MEGVISQRTGKGWLAWRQTKDSKDIFGLKMYEQVNWQMIKSLSNRFWSEWCSAQGLLHEHTHKMYEEKPMKFTLALYKNNNPHLKVLLIFFFCKGYCKSYLWCIYSNMHWQCKLGNKDLWLWETTWICYTYSKLLNIFNHNKEYRRKHRNMQYFIMSEPFKVSCAKSKLLCMW